MPSWLLSILLNFVLRFGVPALVEWLQRHLGIGLDSKTAEVLTDYSIESRVSKQVARTRARRRLEECHGIGCPADTKGLG